MNRMANRVPLTPPFIKALFVLADDMGESGRQSDFPLFQRGIAGDFSKGCACASVAKSPPAPLWKRGECSTEVRA